MAKHVPRHWKKIKMAHIREGNITIEEDENIDRTKAGSRLLATSPLMSGDELSYTANIERQQQGQT